MTTMIPIRPSVSLALQSIVSDASAILHPSPLSSLPSSSSPPLPPSLPLPLPLSSPSSNIIALPIIQFAAKYSSKMAQDRQISLSNVLSSLIQPSSSSVSNLLDSRNTNINTIPPSSTTLAVLSSLLSPMYSSFSSSSSSSSTSLPIPPSSYPELLKQRELYDILYSLALSSSSNSPSLSNLNDQNNIPNDPNVSMSLGDIQWLVNLIDSDDFVGGRERERKRIKRENQQESNNSSEGMNIDHTESKDSSSSPPPLSFTVVSTLSPSLWSSSSPSSSPLFVPFNSFDEILIFYKKFKKDQEDEEEKRNLERERKRKEEKGNGATSTTSQSHSSHDPSPSPSPSPPSSYSSSLPLPPPSHSPSPSSTVPMSKCPLCGHLVPSSQLTSHLQLEMNNRKAKIQKN